jgi:hypothetical protein
LLDAQQCVLTLRLGGGIFRASSLILSGGRTAVRPYTEIGGRRPS